MQNRNIGLFQPVPAPQNPANPIMVNQGNALVAVPQQPVVIIHEPQKRKKKA